MNEEIAALPFRVTRPLRFGDCDPSGIAYFPSYLNILAGVLEEFFASVGAPFRDLIDKRSIGTPTVRLDLSFVHPGFHGDTLDFGLFVRQVGRSSLELEHMVSAGGRLLWSARHCVVATSLDTHKSISWPDGIRTALEERLEKTDA